MYRRRPGGAVFFGVFNIVVGAMGLIFYVCSGLMVAAMVTERSPSLWQDVQSQIPIFTPMATAHIVVSLILCLLLLISGIGLLSMQPWARFLSLTASILALLLNVWTVIFQIAFVNPAMQNRLGSADHPFSRANMAFEATFINFSILGTALVAIIYGTALFITMLLPNVASAFRSGPGPAWYDDFDDAPRRRRSDEWDD
jgi:hypothetical protein